MSAGRFIRGIEDESYITLQHMAIDNKTTVGELINEAIQKFLNSENKKAQESPQEKIERLRHIVMPNNLSHGQQTDWKIAQKEGNETKMNSIEADPKGTPPQ